MTDREYDIGTCEVFFKAPGSSVERNLGHTSGGITVNVSTETTEVEVDQQLDPVDEIITKRAITVSVPLAEFSLENLAMAFPGSTVVTDAVDQSKQKLVIASLSGKSARDFAGALRLHPLGVDADDLSKDFFFPMAAPIGGELAINYTKSDLKTIPLQFKAYPDSNGESLVIGYPDAEE